MTDDKQSKLSELIESIERVHPNADRTFAEILDFLRELQRWREGMPNKIEIDRSTCMDDWKRGWNACVKAIEKAVRE